MLHWMRYFQNKLRQWQHFLFLSISSLSAAGVQEILAQYSRGVTVLEIGMGAKDSSGSCGIYQLAKQYPDSVFVVMHQDTVDFAEQIEREDVCQNIIWLNHLPTVSEIQNLSLFEHFDVIVLNRVAEEVGADWMQAVAFCQNMSQYVFVQPPLETEESYVLENHLPFSLVKRTFVHPPTILRSYTLYADHSQSMLLKIRPPYPDQRVVWRPGINLMTYLAFNGYYPNRMFLVDHLPLDLEHRDWMPNNMIVQGSFVSLIDRADPYNDSGGPGGRRYCSEELEGTRQLILLSQDLPGEQVKQLFCKIYNAENLLQIEATD